MHAGRSRWVIRQKCTWCTGLWYNTHLWTNDAILGRHDIYLERATILSVSNLQQMAINLCVGQMRSWSNRWFGEIALHCWFNIYLFDLPKFYNYLKAAQWICWCNSITVHFKIKQFAVYEIWGMRQCDSVIYDEIQWDLVSFCEIWQDLGRFCDIVRYCEIW